MGLSRTVSEIDGDFSRKWQKNFPSRVFCAPLTGFPLELGIGVGIRRNRDDGATRRSKKFQDRFSRLDTIGACDKHPASHPATLRK